MALDLGKSKKVGPGRYADHLSAKRRSFVEAAVLPELKALGYGAAMDSAAAIEIIRGYASGEVMERPEPSGYFWSEQRRVEEVRRLDRLGGGQFDPELLIFEAACAALNTAISPGEADWKFNGAPASAQ